MEGLIGQSLGNYTIIEQLDAGGVADVFRAESRVNGQIVAIKVMKQEMLEMEQLHDRFLREAQMMASLIHPHIIRVYGTGQHQQTPYMVMQYAEGGSLAQWIARKPLAPAIINRVIAQVADALDYAHAHNTIHRDIKPENILLDAEGSVLLSDFGLAKPIIAEPADHLKTTRGTVLGTPYYISPEHAAGQELDQRSDVYSLGVLLFHLLTGAFPFNSPIPVAIIAQHIHMPPPLITDIRPELSPELAAVVSRALIKNPNERYQSAGELARALQAALGEAALIPAPPAQKPASSPVQTPPPEPAPPPTAATPPEPAPKARFHLSPQLMLALIILVIIWFGILMMVLLSNLPV